MVNRLLALLAGALVTVSLAPFNLWPAALLSSALLYFVLQQTQPAQAALLGWLFGLAMFGSGASWVYVSIHDFGYTSVHLAAFLTVIFCGGLALCSAFSWWLFSLVLERASRSGLAANGVYAPLLFATTWVLSEWLRSWLLTGFPWLYLGYSQTESLLASWAPLIGVYGISFLLCLTGSLAMSLLLTKSPGTNKPLLVVSAFVVTAWLAALPLTQMSWTRLSEKNYRVSMVQANISQHEKWLPEMRQFSFDLYRSMSSKQWQDGQLLIWPEAAIPANRASAARFLDEIDRQAAANNSALITGIPVRDPHSGQVFNSAIAAGNGQGVYHKHRLVPFGEYVPLAGIVGDLMQVFELPMSAMSAGDANQEPLSIADWQTRPLVCYEIVYPGLTASAARVSDVLVTLSNDSWFGSSLGPLQHLQMAQMRALETGRYVLRSTGNGVSAVIAADGQLLARSKQFEREVLVGEFKLSSGRTPWVALGYWLVPIALLVCWLSLAALARRN